MSGFWVWSPGFCGLHLDHLGQRGESVHIPLTSDTASNETEAGRGRVFELLGDVNGIFFWHSVVLTPHMPGSFQRVGSEGSEGACPGVGLDEQGCPALGRSSILWPGATRGSVVRSGLPQDPVDVEWKGDGNKQNNG